MSRWVTALSSILLMIGAGISTNQAVGQSGDGWTILLDGKTMGDWDRVGESNWRLEDGVLVADKRTGSSPAYLVSKNS